MRISIISTEIGVTSSGQARFTVNLARGLQEAGADVLVYCAHATDEAAAGLARAGVRTSSLGTKTESPAFKTRLMTRFNDIDRKLAALARWGPTSDWYLVLSDELIGAVTELRNVRTVHISNGNLALLFLNPDFYGRSPVTFRLLSLDMASRLRAGARHAKLYEVLLANSRFTREFMSYMYGRPVEGIVYPPVDSRVFRKVSDSKGDYCLVLGRNSAEQNLGLIRELAKDIPIRVVGGAKVPGCETLGQVSDSLLPSLYAEARLVLFPTVSEFFGYAVAESLSCGTPVLAFSSGGPSEMIQDGVNGWLCSRMSDFVKRARYAYGGGYLLLEPERIVSSAAPYAMDVVARCFLTILGERQNARASQS